MRAPAPQQQQEASMRPIWIFVTAWILLGTVNVQAALAANVVVGVNVVGVDLASDPEQDELTVERQRYGMKTIRTALGGHGERYTGFVIKAYQHGVGSVVMGDPCAGNSRKHALPPDVSAGRPWGLPAVSDAGPEGFKTWFIPTLARLEAAGVRITAFELGNELNTPRFNADFRPELRSHRILGLADLNNPHDAEASTVAGGYLAYLKVMATLKDLRDHSNLNQSTAILSGMQANWGLPKKVGNIPDAVSVPDSIEFLRQHGLDKLADGYSVHAYPNGDPRQTTPERVAILERDGVFGGFPYIPMQLAAHRAALVLSSQLEEPGFDLSEQAGWNKAIAEHARLSRNR